LAKASASLKSGLRVGEKPRFVLEGSADFILQRRDMELARYDKLKDGSFAAEIAGLPGVVAFGKSQPIFISPCESPFLAAGADANSPTQR
jgi:hypothetical protein